MPQNENIITVVTIIHNYKAGSVEANDFLINSGEIMGSKLHS
jgi:hypothetical protein